MTYLTLLLLFFLVLPIKNPSAHGSKGKVYMRDMKSYGKVNADNILTPMGMTSRTSEYRVRVVNILQI